MLAVFIAPHPNCRYQASVEQLTHAELTLTLKANGIDSEICRRVYAGHDALCFEAGERESGLSKALGRLSSAYMICRVGDMGALYPLYGRNAAYLGDDISGILKYKGKTSETFTRFLLNVARLSGAFCDLQTPLNVLDPVCGKGTTLLEAINAGDSAFGVDVDDKALDELKIFFKKYLMYHHFKHEFSSRSATVLGKPKPIWSFITARDAVEYKSGDTRTLTAAQCDTLLADKLFSREKFHIVAGDLPYGVQHAPHSADKDTAFAPSGAKSGYAKGVKMARFTAEAVPVWANALLPGGCMALSFNAYTLSRDELREQMRQCGLKVMEGGAYDQMRHWVEQAVDRDVAVGVKK